jgi:hypothetical protein
VSTPKKFNGVNEYNLGITAPSKLTNFTTTIHPEAVKTITISANTAGTGLPVEVMYYILVNSSAGKISNAMQLVVDTAGLVTTLVSNSSTVTYPTTVQADAGAAQRTIIVKNPTGISIGSDGVKVFRFYEGVYRQVGSLATASSSLTDSTYNIAANAALDTATIGALQGIIQYSMSYYNSADGAESGLSTPSAELDLSKGGSVLLNSLAVSIDPQVTHKRIYRIGGNLTAFSLVAEITNATTSYNDLYNDTSIPGTLATTEDVLAAPIGLAYLTEAYGMLFGAKGTRLYFSEIGLPDSWPALYFLSFHANVTGIAVVSNGLLVFTRFKTYIVTGSGPTSFVPTILSSDQGCIAHESIASISGSAIWASTDGLCESSGGLVEVISKIKLGKLALTPVSSTVYDEVYYCLNSDGSTVAYDFGLGKIFKEFTFGVDYLVVANDKLYGWYNEVLYELFASSTNESFSYLSPAVFEGRVTEMKTYKKVYVYSDGYVKIDIYIDGILVITEELTDKDSHVIQIPQENQRGFYIQFGVTGTGEVSEIACEAGARQNG